MPATKGAVAVLVLAASVSPQADREATSLLGAPLAPPPIPAERRKALEENLAMARDVYARNPGSADALVWLARRTAYLGRYREAIQILTDGIASHPQDARMYRHRGHRYITVREFDNAAADLSRAVALVAGRPDEVEPDGQPNARNIPTSTLHTNIYYHLGLAHYLRGDLEAALAAYRECHRLSTNPDMLVAAAHWLYMTLRRLDRPGEAHAVLEPVTREMEIIENGSYHRLLLLYKGLEQADGLMASVAEGGLDAVTIGYGVANWHLYNGRPQLALPLFRRIVERHAAEWPAFGYIAAEAELARQRKQEP
ncbi:MAG TPA: tetratricopeptide repeat protein [Vicinamibacterales bacterium]|nr:tetratricopeptide repeat protein [Vicinamibacterales bacterium]